MGTRSDQTLILYTEEIWYDKDGNVFPADVYYHCSLYLGVHSFRERSMQKAEPNIVEAEPRGMLSLYVNVILSVILRI